MGVIDEGKKEDMKRGMGKECNGEDGYKGRMRITKPFAKFPFYITITLERIRQMLNSFGHMMYLQGELSVKWLSFNGVGMGAFQRVWRKILN